MNNEKLYLEIINNLSNGVYFVDTQRRITFWNKASENITGYKEEEIIGKFCYNNILKHIDKDGQQLCLSKCFLCDTINNGNNCNAEVFLRHKNGYRIPVAIRTFPIIEDGKIIGAIEIFAKKSPIVYDDTLIENLLNLAATDKLTGLPNRRKTESYIEFRLKEIERFSNRFCVMFVNLDNFRKFNDDYGHDTGDEILKSIAKSVMYIVRQNDIFCRWSGKEFVGVFEIKENYDIVRLAEKIRVLVAGSEVPYKDAFLSVTASLGVTVALESDDINSVLKRADTLMYQSKKNGKNCFMSDWEDI